MSYNNNNINRNINTFTSLKQRVPGYKPSLRSLRIQINKEIENPTENLYYLFIESTAIVLFTTKIGLSILNELYNIKIGKYDNFINKYDKELKLQLNYMHSNWSLLTILKFYRFCLFNDLLFLNIDHYNHPLYKSNLFNQLYIGSNWQDSFTLTSLACNTDFNILIDLLRVFTDDIEDSLTKMTTHYVTDPEWYVTGKIPTSTKYQYLGGFIVTQYDRAYSTCDFFLKIDLDPNLDGLDGNSFYSKNELVKLYLKPVTKSDVWDILFISVKSADTAIEYFHELSKYDESKEYLIKLQKDSNQEHYNNNNNNSIKNNRLNTESNNDPTDLSLVDNNPNTMVDINWHSGLRYVILSLMLNLKSFNDFSCTSLQFQMLCTLVDPLTQPLPNNKYVTSIDLLANLFLYSCYNDLKPGKIRYQGYETKFHIALNMQRIILNSMERLNCENYNHLQNLGFDNFDNTNIEHWWDLMYSWLPHGLNTQDLELLYMVNIMAVYVIYKLFNDKPIQLNPFLSTLISVWKKLSCVILFSLDIDRMLEQDDERETPLLVRATIRGASALRAVIATVLNNYVEYMEHDFKHEPINTFMSPHGRKLCQGALYTDIRSYAAAMLALGVDLKSVTELFSDLQAGDRFDEDIRYMFEYEYEDYNIVEDEPLINGASIRSRGNDNDRDDSISDNEHIGRLFQQRRCDCIFDDDKIHSARMIQNGEDLLVDKNNMKTYNDTGRTTSNSSLAVRSKVFFEFDYSGKDWRDVPRGLNLYYSPVYKFIVSPKLEDVNKLIVKATKATLTYDESILLLRLVSSCVKEEQESMAFSHLKDYSNDSMNQQGENKAKIVTPDDIYEIWCENSTFEKILYINLELGWRLMDEMLMCNGYRRVLIWFLTHMEINHTLIHYIFELVMGLRGQDFEPNVKLEDMKKKLLHDILINENKEIKSSSVDNEHKDKLPFSRQGPLILSDIETNMLLQEFFTNAAIYLSNNNNSNDDKTTQYDNNDDDVNNNDGAERVSLYTVGLVKLICFMVRTLMENGKIDFTKTECSFELQALLMNWIGLIPEAQQLFFMIKSSIADKDVTNGGSSTNKDNSMDIDGITSDNESDDRSRHYIITSEKIENGDLFKEDDTKSQDSNNGEDNDDIDEYSKKLLKLLPPVVNASENEEENPAFSTLRSFMKRHSFVKGIPVTGRKVIHRGTTIFPMKQYEKPISLKDYIRNYDYAYKT